MIKIDEACIQCTTDSYIKFEENRKKIIFQNLSRKECLKIQIDGCAIKTGEKCDNLLKEGKAGLQGPEYYVELKGEDVGHALKQIIQTIRTIHDDRSPVMAFIVCTNVSPKLSTEIQKFKKLLKDRYNATVVIRERQYEYRIR